MTVLKCLWRVLDFCRRLVLNLIFLGVLVAAALIWLFARPNTPAVEPGTLLVLDLDGAVVESDPLRSISADLKSLMKSRGASTRLIDVTEALRFAGSDERIAGVIIKVDGLTKLGLASARTIGSAIEDYKTASGKPVFSWASGYTQAQYAAAAHADVVADFWKNSALECPSLKRVPSKVLLRLTVCAHRPQTISSLKRVTCLKLGKFLLLTLKMPAV